MAKPMADDTFATRVREARLEDCFPAGQNVLSTCSVIRYKTMESVFVIRASCFRALMSALPSAGVPVYASPDSLRESRLQHRFGSTGERRHSRIGGLPEVIQFCRKSSARPGGRNSLLKRRRNALGFYSASPTAAASESIEEKSCRVSF
jgi:hypothetical protein